MYIRNLPPDTNMTQLVQARLAYLIFQGESCPIFYSATYECWYAWDQYWRPCKNGLGRIKTHFQTTFHQAMRAIATRAKTEKVSPPVGEDAEPNPRQVFLDKTVAALECRETVDKIIRESSMPFDREPVFNMNPMLFQRRNAVVDLALNVIRESRPSDMTSRASNIEIPVAWLANDDLIEKESEVRRARAWEIVWSVYRRVGEPHPDDHFAELGEQDQASFMHMMHLHARILEGIPLCKCVIL